MCATRHYSSSDRRRDLNRCIRRDQRVREEKHRNTIGRASHFNSSDDALTRFMVKVGTMLYLRNRERQFITSNGHVVRHFTRHSAQEPTPGLTVSIVNDSKEQAPLSVSFVNAGEAEELEEGEVAAQEDLARARQALHEHNSRLVAASASETE